MGARRVPAPFLRSLGPVPPTAPASAGVPAGRGGARTPFPTARRRLSGRPPRAARPGGAQRETGGGARRAARGRGKKRGGGGREGEKAPGAAWRRASGARHRARGRGSPRARPRVPAGRCERAPRSPPSRRLSSPSPLAPLSLSRRPCAGPPPGRPSAPAGRPEPRRSSRPWLRATEGNPGPRDGRRGGGGLDVGRAPAGGRSPEGGSGGGTPAGPCRSFPSPQGQVPSAPRLGGRSVPSRCRQTPGSGAERAAEPGRRFKDSGGSARSRGGAGGGGRAVARRH